VAELRSLLQEFGEKPDKLKKAEIITRIVELTEAKGSPLEKPAYWSQVDTAHGSPCKVVPGPDDGETVQVDPTLQAGTPQARGQPPHQDAQGINGRPVEAVHHDNPGVGAVPVSRGRTRDADTDGAERRGGLLPSGVTAYTGEELPSTRSEQDEDGRWESGAGRETGGRRERLPRDPYSNGKHSYDTGPSQDYVRDEASAHPASGEATPKRGPGSGRRLAASAAMLSPDELDEYLEQPAAARAGPGPQPFPQIYRGDRASGEVSGEGGRQHTADMEVCFLGTASCLPSLTRGVSSVAMRLLGKRGAGSSTWIFDAGEGTQIQMQKSWCRPSTIDKIFITHLHGDHSFGVVGLMCLIGQNRDEPLEIYGPAGLRALLRVTLQLTGSRMLPPYRVIELHDIPFLHQRFVREPSSACEGLYAPMDRRFKEVDEGEDLYPGPDGAWRCCQTDTGISVVATAMQHTMPCVGYCVSEPKGEDRLRVDLVEDIVERNKKVDAVRAPHPKPLT
jgi:ribonuclease BN (tRNA processing enzyme)